MRIIAYIDGYNLYHAINDMCGERHFLKWLDIRKLVENYCDLKTDTIVAIKYFSAQPVHLSQSKQKRHASYVKALKHRGITYVEGQFKRKADKWVRLEDGRFEKRPAYEEKESDVNIAIHVLYDALMKNADKALIVTNDSDISPSILMARNSSKSWRANIITPPLPEGRYANHSLISAAGLEKRDSKGQVYRQTKVITEELLLRCQLPEKMIAESGELILRPQKYVIPEEYR